MHTSDDECINRLMIIAHGNAVQGPIDRKRPFFTDRNDAHTFGTALAQFLYSNLDAETDRELSRQLEDEGNGDPTPPQFDCCGNVTQ